MLAYFIKRGAQSFSSGMNGLGLNSRVLKNCLDVPLQFRCPKCGLIYNRDLNACINIAHALKRGMGWGRCEPPEPADEEIGAKPTLNAGSSRL
jgi:hypothetical protein